MIIMVSVSRVINFYHIVNTLWMPTEYSALGRFVLACSAARRGAWRQACRSMLLPPPHHGTLLQLSHESCVQGIVPYPLWLLCKC